VRPLVVAAVVAGLLSPLDAAAYLTFVEAYVDGENGVDGLDKAQDVAVSPDGLHAYAVSEGDNAIVRFDRSTVTGALTFVEAIVDGQNGVTGLALANAVAIAPDGSSVYAVSGVNAGAVAVFARNALSGALTFVEAETNGMNGVSGLTVGEDVVVSPDGKHVYVAGFTPGAVLTFARNAGTGALTFVEKDEEGVNGLDGIAFATSLVISPDGKHVYVTGDSDDSVAVFARDAGTGALTFVEAQRNGVGGVDGIDGPFAVGISPDGKHVYAGGSNDDAVAVFARDATTGALTFVQSLHDGVNGVDGLGFPQGFVVTPDGSALLVAAARDDAVGVFARDTLTGMLTFVETISAAGLGGVNSVHLAPGAAHLYTTARSSGAVALLAVDSSPPTTTSSSSTTTSTSTTDTSVTTTSTTDTTVTSSSSTSTTTSTPPSTSATSSTSSSTSTLGTGATTSSSSSSPTSSSLPGSTSMTSTSTSTTAGPTTTSLVSSCVEPGSASFSSVRCRIEALRTKTAGTAALGDLRPKLATPLGKAVDRAGEAQSFCAGRDTKRSRARLKQTTRQLVQYAHRLGGLKARKTAPADVREPLIAEANEIRGDATTLRRSLDCSAGGP
jgi:6-phosphogluconolactonase (cycloisomerase 2 family)